MAENKLKAEAPEEPVQEPKPKKRTSRPARRLIKLVNVFGVLDRNQIVHAMPFILFVTLLIIGYIANSYYAERVIREIDRTKTELKEKRAEYISTKSLLMNNSRQSQVAGALVPAEIKETTEPPRMIVVQDPIKKKK
ncbi:MAG TPA: FtsL-like putative cell division protein [Bacteroidia bacterium]|nr:FtsL-like putative cell division protein [Bacteroidia bacterium]